MELSRRELIEQKVLNKEPLTLDERVYYYESKKLDQFCCVKEPVLTSFVDVFNLLGRHGRVITECDVTEWLDKENVPK